MLLFFKKEALPFFLPTDPNVRLHLIRHGHYALLGGEPVLGGRLPGHALSAQGRAEAERVADALAARPLVAVWCGPLERVRETAAAIAARHGLAPRPDPALDELDFGAWTGLSFAALEGRADWAAWNAHRGTALPPGGEGVSAVLSRMLDAVRRLHALHPDGEAAVVGHAEPIRLLLCHALGMAPDLFWRLEVSPASRSVLEVHGAAMRVLGVNLPTG